MTGDQTCALPISESFLTGKMENIDELSSMRQVKELLDQMRNCYSKLKQDGKNFLDADNWGQGTGSAQSDHEMRRKTMREGHEGIG